MAQALIPPLSLSLSLSLSLRALGLALVLLLLASPATARRICTGDCGGDGNVTVDEIVRGVDIALGAGAARGCTAFDAGTDGAVDVSEIVAGVNHALAGCPLVTRADAAFWQTLWAEADREEESLALHQQAIDANPNDGASHFLKGMMHLYRYGQAIQNFSEFSEFAKSEIALASRSLDLAVENTPSSRTYPGFRGAATYQYGVTFGDAELEALGIEQLRESMEIWPLFNRFSFLGTVAAVVGADDPLFDESLWHLEELLKPEGIAQCTPVLCGNDGRAPRNLEGSGLLFGDIFAKGGKAAQARAWYQLSSGAGTATNWRFAELARERAATLDQRVAAYQDEDPSNDPQLVGLARESCAVCHAR